jgi:flagellar hook protein FlgE
MVDPATNLPLVYAKLDAGGNLTIKARNPSDTMTLTDVTGSPLAIGSLGMGASPISPAVPVAPTMLTAMDPTNAVDTEGWWTLEYKTPTGAVIDAGELNFTGAGLLNAIPDIDGKVIADLPNIDWSNGSSLQDIAFDMSGFTQFSGDYNVITSIQNGAELGLRTAVSIDKDGFVTAQFSNGQSARIFKVPVATFANANGLDSLTGNVFRESNTSGSFNLREAGKGSAGTVAGGSLESSNVDLADEFAKMIVTQRAYSANTKVISTADQMTQELLQLR